MRGGGVVRDGGVLVVVWWCRCGGVVGDGGVEAVSWCGVEVVGLTQVRRRSRRGKKKQELHCG